jgi:hypothetical protein
MQRAGGIPSLAVEDVEDSWKHHPHPPHFLSDLIRSYYYPMYLVFGKVWRMRRIKKRALERKKRKPSS